MIDVWYRQLTVAKRDQFAAIQKRPKSFGLWRSWLLKPLMQINRQAIYIAAKQVLLSKPVAPPIRLALGCNFKPDPLQRCHSPIEILGVYQNITVATVLLIRTAIKHQLLQWPFIKQAINICRGKSLIDLIQHMNDSAITT